MFRWIPFLFLLLFASLSNAAVYEIIETAVLDDDPDSIATSQSAVGAGSLTIDGALASGGTATLPEAQKVRITSAGNDSGVTFTITGTDADGTTINEDVTGANASTADSTQYFKTITDVATDGATGSTVTVGTEADLGMVTRSVDKLRFRNNAKITLSAELVAGTGTFGFQHTVDNPSGTYTDSFSVDANWISSGDSGGDLDPSTDTDGGENGINFHVRAVRGLVSTGSATGQYKFVVIQGDNR